MFKMIMIFLGIIIVGVLVYISVPMMKNPVPDYYSVQGKTLEHDGPNMYRKHVTLKEYFKGRRYEY